MSASASLSKRITTIVKNVTSKHIKHGAQSEFREMNLEFKPKSRHS